MPDAVDAVEASLIGIRNRCLMHLLERIALRFNGAGIPLMVLKGAALNLTVYERPSERAMADLDLLVKPEHTDDARALLEEAGCLRGAPLVREDFFPRFYYETDYIAGKIYPMKIDLHVRPVRPLRYARLLPDAAFWDRADRVRIGRAVLLIPSTEDMLIHLAVHAAIHGFAEDKWLVDIRRWIQKRHDVIDWEAFLSSTSAWRLTLPVREALVRVSQEHGAACPVDVLRRLSNRRENWRDRLALRHAPHDAAHPIRHVAVNVLTTPGASFVLGYLRAVLVPGPEHMEENYFGRHWAWLPCAHLARWCRPVTKRFSWLRNRFHKIETQPSPIHGLGVFATRDIQAGELIARYRGRPVEGNGVYVGWHDTRGGSDQRYEITGRLRFLNHACSANAEFSGFQLIAARPIRDGEEITINYGSDTCECRRKEEPATDPEKVSAAEAA
jgi:hypothetical protein